MPRSPQSPHISPSVYVQVVLLIGRLPSSERFNGQVEEGSRLRRGSAVSKKRAKEKEARRLFSARESPSERAKVALG